MFGRCSGELPANTIRSSGIVREKFNFPDPIPYPFFFYTHFQDRFTRGEVSP